MFIIEYRLQDGSLGKIALDYGGYTVAQAKADIPKALKDEGIDFTEYRIVEIMQAFG